MPRWLLWSTLAVVCWGLWAVISKLIGAELSAAQSQALSTVGLLPILVVLGSSQRLPRDAGGRRGMLRAFASGVLTCVGNVAYYHALGLGGKAATVVPLTALYPLVTVVLAVLILGERLGIVQNIGVVLSLGAVYILNVGGEGQWLTPWLAYALVPIVLWGASGLLQKMATGDVSGELSTLGFLAAFVPAAAAILLVEPPHGPPSARTWLLVVALGLSFGLGNYALLLAFAGGGKASVITPLVGLYPLVSVPLAIAFLGERIGAREAVGITLALVSVVALSTGGRDAAGRVAVNVSPLEGSAHD